MARARRVIEDMATGVWSEKSQLLPFYACSNVRVNLTYDCEYISIE